MREISSSHEVDYCYIYTRERQTTRRERDLFMFPKRAPATSGRRNSKHGLRLGQRCLDNKRSGRRR